MLNLKDLKKFPGNKNLNGEFILFPVDEKNYTVADIPNLPANRVNVRAIIHQGKKVDPKTGKRIRPLRPILCLVSDLPDKDQLETILEMRKQKKLELATANEGKHELVTGNEITLNFLIDKYIVKKCSKQSDASGTERILSFWREHLGEYILDQITAEDIPLQIGRAHV